MNRNKFRLTTAQTMPPPAPKPAKPEEYILCAAIWINNEHELHHQPYPSPSGWTLCGWRHCQIIELYASMIKRPITQEKYIQGFLTNKNQFVDRKRAGEIAFRARQTEKLIHELTSEDLY
jgi:hypothetical protein